MKRTAWTFYISTNFVIYTYGEFFRVALLLISHFVTWQCHQNSDQLLINSAVSICSLSYVFSLSNPIFTLSICYASLYMSKSHIAICIIDSGIQHRTSDHLDISCPRFLWKRNALENRSITITVVTSVVQGQKMLLVNTSWSKFNYSYVYQNVRHVWCLTTTWWTVIDKIEPTLSANSLCRI